MATLTEAQYQAKLDKIKKAIGEARGKAEVAGLKTLEGLIKRRVFNQGQGTNKPLGPYRSAAYRKFRTQRGRQVSYKDLELTGQTRRTLIVGTYGSTFQGRVRIGSALGWSQDRGAQIAAWQEEQLNIKIWRPNNDELNVMLKAMLSTIAKEVLKAVR